MSRTKKPRRKRDISPTPPQRGSNRHWCNRCMWPQWGPIKLLEPVRSFETFTGDLHRLAEELVRAVRRPFGRDGDPRGSTSIPGVRKYSTSVALEVILVNARDAKHVPGRKTDISDAQWLQRLHEYGLLRASFRLKGEVAIMRAYLRQRERLLDCAASAHPAHAKRR